MIHIKKFNHLLNLKEKQKVIFLLFLILIAMFLETLGVGLIIPIFKLITDINIVDKYPTISEFLFKISPSALFSKSDIQYKQFDLINGAIVVIILVYLIKAFFMVFLSWTQSTFITKFGIKLSDKLFSGYLDQPYSFHLQRNSALLIRNVNQTLNLPAALEMTLILITEIMIVVGISILLIIAEPFGALIVIIVFLASGYYFQLYTKKHLSTWGEKRHFHEGQRIKHIQQGLGGVKDLKLMGREKVFSQKFLQHATATALVARNQKVLKTLPRLWLEIMIVTCLSILLFLMLKSGKSISELIPTLGLFAAASFRLMPSANRILGSIQQLRYETPVINNIYSELVEIVPKIHNLDKKKILPFKNSIKLEKIGYSYQNTSVPTLNDINLEVPFGSQVGFVGESGSGKSTLINIILSLLKPTQGKIEIDGVNIQNNPRGWQNQIGYVPQDIFLTDDTLRNNIAFAISSDNISEQSVKEAIIAANISDFVDSLPDGLNTMVGERGVRLSGGQRQRIGIARALYHNPKVLVLDEATSSLDTKTEREIMEGIVKLKKNKTVLIVAHRLSTVSTCDVLFKLENGKIVQKGKFEDVVSLRK